MTVETLPITAMTPSRWLLAIDTSTERVGLALFDGTLMGEVSWHAGRTQTISVLPRINSLLDSLDLSLANVGAVAIARGPGTFTGLRVGLSIAKGMSIVGERSLIAIDTLEVTAAPFLLTGSPVLAVLPAGRHRLVWVVYGKDLKSSEPRNTTLEQLQTYLASHPDMLVIGEFLPDQRAVLAGSHRNVLSCASGARRPGVLAELAWARWIRGDIEDPTTIEPLYVHGKAMGGSTGG
jgi:tRNA threonylcarbamoyladenosine biosynthesis protein TsaB